MPNRIIKESITTSDTVDQLTPEEERFFYRLITKCDDFGRFDARPTVLRAACFPLKIDSVTDEDVASWVDTLADVGLVMLYEQQGRPYLQMVTWGEHQQRRASKSKYPSPDDANCTHLKSMDIKSPRIRERKRIRDTRPTDEYDASARENDTDHEEPVGLSVESEEVPEPNDDMSFEDVRHRYEKHLGMIGPAIFRQLSDWNNEHGMGAGTLIAAIDITAQAKADKKIRGSPDKYLDGVIRGLYNDGVRTVADMREQQGPQTQEEIEAYIAQIAATMEG